MATAKLRQPRVARPGPNHRRGVNPHLGTYMPHPPALRKDANAPENRMGRLGHGSSNRTSPLFPVQNPPLTFVPRSAALV